MRVLSGRPPPPDEPAQAPASDAGALRELRRCVGCGLCNAVFDAYARADRTEFWRPSTLALSIGRSDRAIGRAKEYFASLERGDVELLERSCPVGVPFGRVAAEAKRLAERDAVAVPVETG
jgi:succinate dehydrogenase/fumarate reductase-like Fe-S protein